VLVQAIINLFAVMGLAPLTGVPLPFVSYGNSSLMATLFAVGLILNVARGGSAKAARRATPTGAGKLRVVQGGRAPATKRRSAQSGARKAKGRSGGGGNGGARRTRHGGRRRASG
jgi:cell division protein FtsW